MRRPAILRAVRCPRVPVSTAFAVMVIVVTVVLPIVVFVAVMASVMASVVVFVIVVVIVIVVAVVVVVIVVATMMMVAIGNGRRVMQHLLFKNGDLPLQQLPERGRVRRGRVVRLTKHTEE